MDLGELTTLQLFSLNAEISAELRRRKVVRTANLTGCYAERLFSEAFGWVLERNSKAGFDSIHQGVRYQIKARRVTKANPSRQLGEFDRFAERRFDRLAAVIFSEDYTVHRAAIMDHEALSRLSTVVKGRQRFLLKDHIWGEPDVEDVTERVRAAQASLP